MLELLESLDRDLFLMINGFNSPIADFFMWHASRKYHWLPFYLLLFYWVFKKYRFDIWKVVIGLAVIIVITDQVSVNIFKENFQRFRPCHNLDLKEIVHLINNKCGGKYGFISSHASNYFGISSFLGMILNKGNSMRNFYWLMLWASFISYSRIYMGVHYPSDVFVGAIFGLMVGLSIYGLVRKFKILKTDHD